MCIFLLLPRRLLSNGVLWIVVSKHTVGRKEKSLSLPKKPFNETLLFRCLACLSTQAFPVIHVCVVLYPWSTGCSVVFSKQGCHVNLPWLPHGSTTRQARLPYRVKWVLRGCAYPASAGPGLTWQRLICRRQVPLGLAGRRMQSNRRQHPIALNTTCAAAAPQPPFLVRIRNVQC